MYGDRDGGGEMREIVLRNWPTKLWVLASPTPIRQASRLDIPARVDVAVWF